MAKEVEPAALKRLLDLQTEDSAIKQLHHRRDTLPEATRYAEVSDRLAELDSDLEIARKQNDEIGREQDRLEGEIQLVEQKIGREEQRMFSGSISNPKELSAIQAEVASLKKKRSGMEDDLLEVMEQKEQAAAALERIEGERSETGEEAGRLEAIAGELTGDIDRQLGEHNSRRTEVVGQIPSDLLALYDRLREQKAGVGAAALRNGTCEGCHTKLPAKEVERLRSEGGLQRCDNCRRILVVV